MILSANSIPCCYCWMFSSNKIKKLVFYPNSVIRNKESSVWWRGREWEWDFVHAGWFRGWESDCEIEKAVPCKPVMGEEFIFFCFADHIFCKYKKLSSQQQFQMTQNMQQWCPLFRTVLSCTNNSVYVWFAALVWQTLTHLL